MVNELRDLMQRATDAAPIDHSALGDLLVRGRRRVRVRRAKVATGTALAAAALVGATQLMPGSPGGEEGLAAAGVPTPPGNVLRLAEARSAVADTDYEVLAQVSSTGLDRANGTTVAGMTDDGLVLLAEAPNGADASIRLSLFDPTTEKSDTLPTHGDASYLIPVALGADRLVLVSESQTGQSPATLSGHILDRSAGTWTTVRWSSLPAGASVLTPRLGPDGRIYVGVPAESAEGNSYAVWSVSPTDGDDVRDEGLRVGDLAFNDDAMVWTDATNGDPGQMHVRDVTTGRVRTFDPGVGERCNLLGLAVGDETVTLSQYCGTYTEGRTSVRDDRVQVLGLDGGQRATIQDSGIEMTYADATHVVLAGGYSEETLGTYVYDTTSDRFLRVADSVSHHVGSSALLGPLPDDVVLWGTSTGEDDRTEWLSRMD